jgi:hypothetical protein
MTFGRFQVLASYWLVTSVPSHAALSTVLKQGSLLPQEPQPQEKAVQDRIFFVTSFQEYLLQYTIRDESLESVNSQEERITQECKYQQARITWRSSITEMITWFLSFCPLFQRSANYGSKAKSCLLPIFTQLTN